MNDQLRIVEFDSFERTKRLLIGSIANGGPNSLSKGEKVSDEYLANVNKHQWFDIRLSDESKARVLESLKESLEQKKHQFDLDYQEKEKKLKQGDELPPGANMVVRVYVAQRRKIQVGDKMAGRHGIGRLDLVENRFTGMKSRGCYETPGGTILLKAHRAIESLTLDSKAGHLKDELMPKYAQLIYDGFWWSPERKASQALIDDTQEYVSGNVEISLYKGNASILGRSSEFSLYDAKIVTFEDDENAYNQADATGFIKINSLRLKQIAKRKRKTNR